MTGLIVGAWLVAASASSPDGITLYSSRLASPSGAATIVQTGPPGNKPTVRKAVGPGYSIFEQESGGNSAIVIQRQGGD